MGVSGTGPVTAPARRGPRRGLGADRGGQLGDGLMLEQLPGLEVQAGLAGAGDDLEARMESTPRSKKFSRTPTRPTPSTPAVMRASASSTGLRGAT
jgi:hypothetical protein